VPTLDISARSGNDSLAGGGEMSTLMRRLDWSKTPLGRREVWPQSLRTAVDIVLSSRYAMFVWWGPHLVNLYNDAYRPFLGKKHPHALGQSARLVWAEIWHLIGPRTEAVMERGQSTFDEALLLVMERYGYPEETYFTFSYSPLRDDKGDVGGIFCAVTDDTSRVIGERRLQLLREVAAKAPETESPEQVCAAAATGLSGNARDIPFALLYLSDGGARVARLTARVGFDVEDPAAPALIDLDDTDAIWPLANANSAGEPFIVENLGLRFEHLPAGAWDRPAIRAVIMSLPEQGQTSVAGFLIIGLNPYLLFDEAYRAFIGLLAGQIAAGIANARIHAEERRRAQALGDSERQFRTLADSVPLLAWMARPDGWIFWYNRRWYEYTGASPAKMEGWGWQSVHHPDVLPGVLERWRASITKGKPFEMVFPLRGADGIFRPFLTRAAPVHDASGRIVRWFGTNTDIAAQREAEDALRRINELLEERVAERTTALRESESRFRLLVEGVVEYAIFMLDPYGYVTNWNPGAKRIKGYSASEIVGRHFSVFYTDEDRHSGLPDQALTTAARTGRFEAEGWRVRKDGSRFWGNVVIDAIRDDAGELIGFAKITRDRTEHRAAEERLRQAQKMEAIGQLTGGVAHDFNNLLTVIFGNLESLLRRLPADGSSDLRRHALAANRSATRAAQLTRQLLAFSRRQPLEPKPINLNRLVTASSEMLQRTLGELVTIETVLGAGLWWVQADPSELENALLNLAVNARDAMPDGGKLTVETANTHLDDAYAAQHGELSPGEYVLLAVSDSGTGMPKEVILKAFEPFFTTKPIGQGTGLGLSQVYGFIKQSGGHVKICSEPGEGTSVKLYLPRLSTGSGQSGTAGEDQTVPMARRGETVLVVEDDDDVRAHTVDILRELGYRVVAAPDGPSALRALEANSEVRLLFTDVGLPGGLSGRQLADEARLRYPKLRVLFTTGYARNAIVHHGRLDPGVDVVMKPFTYAGLAAKIRMVLDRPAARA
jgi:PAS domain S-box-containing protein